MLRELAEKVKLSIYGCKRSIKISCFLFLAALAVIFSFFSAGATLAYNVNYHGKIIATVKSKQQFAQAIDIVKKTVNGTQVEKAVSAPEYSAAIVLNSDIDTEYVLADAIIQNTDEIIYASVLSVNGEEIACIAGEPLNAFLEEYKNSFSIEGVECVSEFTDDIRIESGYYLSDDIDDIETAKTAIQTLTVKTVANVSRNIDIAYKTITEKTSDEFIGYSSVVTKGETGLRCVTESVTYLNGVEAERQQISDVTVKEPVDKVVLVGTAKSKASAAEKAVAKASGFVFPLPSGSWTVTSYFGDGRGHKGIDLCASKGTSIFAAKGGTVTYAGYWSAYGYCVDIDHGNGIKTRYAHASKLCVNVGDTVEAGDVVALVGRTGRASGAHLHFEVIVNGTSIDPAPYLGLD